MHKYIVYWKAAHRRVKREVVGEKTIKQNVKAGTTDSTS